MKKITVKLCSAGRAKNIMRLLSSADIKRIEWEKCVFWIVQSGSKDVGFCSLEPLYSEKSVYFSYAVLDKKYRGLGLQKKLIKSRLSWSRRHGFKHAIVETLKDNYPSITNLIRCGFKFYRPKYEWSIDAFYFYTKL